MRYVAALRGIALQSEELDGLTHPVVAAGCHEYPTLPDRVEYEQYGIRRATECLGKHQIPILLTKERSMGHLCQACDPLVCACCRTYTILRKPLARTARRRVLTNQAHILCSNAFYQAPPSIRRQVELQIHTPNAAVCAFTTHVPQSHPATEHSKNPTPSLSRARVTFRDGLQISSSVVPSCLQRHSSPTRTIVQHPSSQSLLCILCTSHNSATLFTSRCFCTA